VTGGAAQRRRVVVIGVGNTYRRDDGIGQEVLSRLRARAADDTADDTADGNPDDTADGNPDDTADGNPDDTVQLVTSDGEPASLVEAWTGASLAVVVDAVLAAAPGPPAPGRLHRIVLYRPDPVPARPVSSHGLGLGEAVRLGVALGRMPDRLIIHAVEAADVGHGPGLSPAVAAAAGPLTAAVLRDLRAG